MSHDPIALAKSDRAKLERSGHVRVREPMRLRKAFVELGLLLLEAETGLHYGSYGTNDMRSYVEAWAMPQDLAAAKTLACVMEEAEKQRKKGGEL